MVAYSYLPGTAARFRSLNVWCSKLKNFANLACQDEHGAVADAANFVSAETSLVLQGRVERRAYYSSTAHIKFVQKDERHDHDDQFQYPCEHY